MGEAKLSWTDLRRALVARASVSEREANAFLSAFNAQLIEALRQERQVKVNGLGTFKLQAVAPRKSVDVTSGEDITIEGYNKIAFMPEAGVKELVEKGASELGSTAAALGLNEEPKEEFNPLKKLGEQAEEIVEILGELGQRPNGGAQNTEHRAQTDEGAQNTEHRAQTDEEPKLTEAVYYPTEPTKTEKTKKTAKPKEQKKQETQYHFVRDTLICVVILLMLLLIGYFFLRSQMSRWIEDFVNQEPKTEVTIEATEEPKESMIPVIVDSMPQKETEPAKPEVKETAKEEKAQKETTKEEKAVENIQEYKEWLLTEEVTEGSRLAWIAKKHYGSKVYWVYLYDANKKRIKNPGRIAVGTPIRVPKLSAAQRDTTSAEFIQLQKEAERAIKK